MTWLRVALSRAAGMLRGARMEDRLDEEVRTHIEFLTEENLSRGMNAAEARRAALLEFGGITGTKERYREQRGAPAVEAVWQDVRYGIRSLAKNRVFTCTAVLTLALGIGGATAVFTMVHGIVLRGLPYKDPERLVLLREISVRAGAMSASWHDFLDWRAQARSFSHMAAIKSTPFSLSGGGAAERLPGLNVSGCFFTMLGVAPVIGRGFTDSDDTPRAEPVLILSHAVWMRRYGGDEGIVGRSIPVDGRAHTVVGILPADFRFFEEAELFRPIGLEADRMGPRGGDHGSFVFARVGKGVTLEHARAEMDAIAAGLSRQYPEYNAGTTVRVEPLSVAGANLQQTLFMLLGAVGCLLLIACVNVSNLLLARGEARRPEMQLRVALGAGRGRLVRQLLTESLLLASAGAALGVLLAHFSLGALNRLVPEETRRLAEIRIDASVLAGVILLAFATAITVGLAPGLRATLGTGLGTLRGGGRSGRPGFRGLSFRNVMVAAEVGASLVLLVASGLLLRSLMNLYRVDPGFRAERLLTTETALPPAKYPADADQVRFFDRLLAQLRETPGVEAAASTFCLPLNGGCWASVLIVDGRSPVRREDLPMVEVNEVSPGYFRTLGVPLLRGRDFEERDTTATPRVAVVSEAFARMHFPKEDPIGRRIKLAWPESPAPYLTVVGVVGDIRRSSLATEFRPEVYRSVRQFGSDAASIVIRTRLADPMSVAESARRAAMAVDRDVPLFRFRSIDYYVRQSTESRQLPLTVVGVFAVLALAMAGIGLYGIVNYTVAARAHELGIRMALGASRWDLVKLVFGQGSRLALAGVAVGLASALALTRLLQHLLFGVESADPLTLGAVAGLLTATVLLACWLPAHRAARTDPATSLRSE